jgi:hypothetical protein
LVLCFTYGAYEALENFRDDPFFAQALGLTTVPSTATLRQRLDERAEAFLPLVTEASVQFLCAVDANPSALATGHVPLDADVTPLDNSKTSKEGVSRTYKGHDGYARMPPNWAGKGTAWSSSFARTASTVSAGRRNSPPGRSLGLGG